MCKCCYLSWLIVSPSFQRGQCRAMKKGTQMDNFVLQSMCFSFRLRWTINTCLLLVWGVSRRSVKEANMSQHFSNSQCLFPKQLNSDKHYQSNWHWIKRWVRCLRFQKASLKKVDAEAIQEDLLLDSYWFVMLCIKVSEVLLKRRLKMNQRNCFSSQCQSNTAWSTGDSKAHGMFNETLKGCPACF